MLNFTQKQPMPETRTCEICGREFILGYGYSIAASWLVTGHCGVGGYMCDQSKGGQHWGCTPEHAIQAMVACLQHDEHMSINNLLNKHQASKDQGNELIAPDDKWMLDRFPNFPFTDMTKAKKPKGGTTTASDALSSLADFKFTL